MNPALISEQRESLEYSKAQEMQKLEEYVFENVDALVCITKSLGKEINKLFPKSCQSQLILPVGFSENFLRLPRISSSEFKYDLIYSGNFSKWKGVDYLIEALAEVKNSLPRFKSVLIGTTNKDREYYESLISCAGIQDNVELLDRVPHKKIAEYIVQSRIGVLPNSYDGDGLLFTSPLKLYEYFGAGMKVVSSRLPPIESSFPEKLIYWAAPEDASSLAEAIIRAYFDTNHKPEDMQAFAKEYTWSKRAENFVSFLERL